MATLLDEVEVAHVTEAEAAAALDTALEEAGLTLEELKGQAASDAFESTRSRLAWHVVLAVGADV